MTLLHDGRLPRSSLGRPAPGRIRESRRGRAFARSSIRLGALPEPDRPRWGGAVRLPSLSALRRRLMETCVRIPASSSGYYKIRRTTQMNLGGFIDTFRDDIAQRVVESRGRSPESGSVSRSVSVLALRCRPGRSPGPGRLTTQVGAGNHPGQDAKPTRHRLSLLGEMRRRPAIGRWSPRQFVHLSAVCRDSSGRCSRKRVCTIATRNKTSHRAAHGCDPYRPASP